MKYAFTTLGCPEWELDAIIARAVEYGYHGVDFRGYLGTMEVYDLPEFSADAAVTARRFADAGLEVPCFSSGAWLMASERKSARQSLDEVRAYAELCPIFGATFIRVFGQSIGRRSWPEAIDEAGAALRAMADIAADCGATVLLETHDAWTDSDRILAVLERADTPAAAVLWDVHHPWRLSNESPGTTWSKLGRHVRYTHWKDAILPDHQLCLMGEGGLPLADFYKVLNDGGYDGYYTLEWEKKHHPELPEPEVAFPNFISEMEKLAAR